MGTVKIKKKYLDLEHQVIYFIFLSVFSTDDQREVVPYKSQTLKAFLTTPNNNNLKLHGSWHITEILSFRLEIFPAGSATRCA